MQSLEQIVRKPTFMERIRRGISARSIGYTAALFLAAAAPNFSCTTEQDGSGQSSYGCTMDNDCKGDRVCVEGECVSPSGMNGRDPGRQYEDNGNVADGDAGNAVEDNEPPQDTGMPYEDAGREEDTGTEPICIDNDEDGFYLTENCGTSIDCNDNARDIYFGAQEICDTIDNNCDGQVDENCPCVGEETQECGTTDVGQCQYGTQTCDIDGKWGECSGNVEPVQEACDGLDNDCNGRVDEIFNNFGEICSAGVGECEREGEYVCSNDGLNTVCNAVPGRAGREVCDGLDNDCNGRIDNGIGHTSFSCEGGHVYWFDSCGNREERKETCDHNERCEEGVCILDRGEASYCNPCERDRDCIEGMICDAWAANPDVSFCRPEDRCNQDANCGGDYHCNLNERICYPERLHECLDGDSWNRDSCGNWINVSEECGADQFCADETCASNRFTVRGLIEEILTDSQTGRMWQRTSPDQAYTWREASGYCENLVIALVVSDWRLPTRDELSEIDTNVRRAGQCHLYNEFEGGCGEYWSSSNCAGGAEKVFYKFQRNRNVRVDCANPDFRRLVRCIHNGGEGEGER